MAGQKDITAVDARTSFLSLPSELRNEVYELILLQDEPIYPWARYSWHQTFTPGLLRANKVIHNEASPLFYGRNRFSLISDTPEEIALFFEQIGRRNAGYIRHILIDFPGFLYLDPGNITLEVDSVGILANICKSCANVTTLTTTPYSTHAVELRLDYLDNHTVANEALKLVDDHFRAISTLQEIVLEVYEDDPSSHIRTIMKSHGWTLSTIGDVEEEDWVGRFGDSGDNYYEYDDEAGYHGYDIDDDSDAW